MLVSLLKYYLEFYITDTALKVSQSLYFFTAPISHGVENYFPRLWGTGISDSILLTWYKFEEGFGSTYQISSMSAFLNY